MGNADHTKLELGDSAKTMLPRLAQEVQALKESGAYRSNSVQRYIGSIRFPTEVKQGKTKEVITLVQVEITKGPGFYKSYLTEVLYILGSIII